MSETCQNCRFWVAWPEGKYLEYDIMVGEGQVYGRCHRYPGQQHTEQNDWCGEWCGIDGQRPE